MTSQGTVCETMGVFTLILDGSQRASELVAQGKYDVANIWFTDERFPIEKHAPLTRRIEFIELDHDSTSEEALTELKRRGLERPTYEEALAFGAKYPEEQKRRHVIVFLHKPVLGGPNGPRFVLALRGNACRRYLVLRLYDGRWSRHYVFAGVRKSN